MKIVYCISAMFKSGGIKRVITNKVNYLVNYGYEACIITPDQVGRPDFFPIDERVVTHCAFDSIIRLLLPLFK